MPIKDSDFYKLDSNIDGFFADTESENIIVENMIGVVGASDGPPAFPSTTTSEAPLSKDDVAELKRRGLRPDRIKNQFGHGLIYDKDGKYRARKGELFFRDGKDNFSTLRELSNISKHIKNEGVAYRLKDDSLVQAGYTNRFGISLDELLRDASTSTDKVVSGNILQLTRNITENESSVSVPLVSTSIEAVVSIVGRVVVSGTGYLRIVHDQTGTVMSTTYFDHPKDYDMPTYVSFTGTFPEAPADTIDGVTVEQQCERVLWDYKTKSFVKVLDRYISDETTKSSFSLECYDESLEELKVFSKGHINVIVMDEILNRGPAIKSDWVPVEETVVEVEFDEEYPDDNYSVSIQTEENVQFWYDGKTEKGFVIHIERPYVGNVFWTTVRNP